MVAPAPPHDRIARSADDQIIVMHDVPWSHYEAMLAVRGEAPRPRLAYLQGELEIMSPSKDHELITALLDRLVQVAAAELKIDLWPVRSWTVRLEPRERGLEPDACFTLGDPRGKHVPDLAIEVVWTSGGIEKLDIYRLLGVGEVWFWQDSTLRAYRLRGTGDSARYEERQRSDILPALDLDLLASLVHHSPREAEEQLLSSLRGA